MMRRKSILKIFGLLLLCYLCYLLGVFTHILEKDFNNFSYSPHVDFDIALKLGENAFKYIDINNHNYSYLYDSEKTCNADHIDLVILVKSKLSHFEQRKAIRSTWGNEIKNKIYSIRLVFLLGIISPNEYRELQNTIDDVNEHHQIDKERDDYTLKRNSNEKISFKNIEINLNEKLKDENKLYNDIIQQNFHDTYYNNTLKAIMSLQWIDKYCPDATYFLFIDDDYYLNPNLLLNYLQKNIQNNETLFNNLYAGFVFKNSSPMRHRFSKWYISLDEYPYDKFPPYVSAGCYILSKKSANLFFKATRLVTLFRFDDIYLGILAYKLNIKPLNIEDIHFYPPTFDKKEYLESVIASHGFSPSLLTNVWNKLYRSSELKTI